MNAMVPVYIVEMLKEETNARHCLKQVEIEKLLKSRHNAVVQRNALGRYLRSLRDIYPDNIFFKTKQRTMPDGKTSDMVVGVWWEDSFAFEASEVRLMADAIMASPAFKFKQKRDLIERIGLLNPDAGIGALLNVAEPASLTHTPSQENPEFLLNIEILDEAISKQCQVSFDWGEYDLKGSFGPADERNTTTVEPRQLAFNNGHYYLLATYPGKDKLYHFRIDLLVNVAIKFDEKNRPIKAAHRKNKPEETLQKYLNEHLMMFGGNTQKALIRVKREDDHPARLRVFETFGKSATFVACDSEGVIYEVRGNLNALRYWIKQNSNAIAALFPESLRQSLAEDAKKMACDYE